MNRYFENLFVDPVDKTKLRYEGTVVDGKWMDGVLVSSSREWKVEKGIPLFDTDAIADQFDEEDFAGWAESGRHHRHWTKGLDYGSEAQAELCREAAALGKPILEVASGPGLGLLPGIVPLNPSITAMASDACSLVVKSWQRYFAETGFSPNISFASFDAVQMPLRPESIDLVTSFIGLSSIRYGCDADHADRLSGAREVYRVLKPGGQVFAIENAYERDGLEELCRQMGWDFEKRWGPDYETIWPERFEKAGFVINSDKLHVRNRLTPDDNEYGEAADRLGIDVWLEFRAYKLMKV